MRKVIACLLFVVSPAMFGLEGPWPNNRFAEQYLAMTLDELLTQMCQDVPTRRGFVAEAIAAHKTEAWPTLGKALQDADWRVRACALTALELLLPRDGQALARKQKQDRLSGMPGIVEALTALLGDSHFWVRCCAARVLGSIGEPAASAADALAKLCGDEHPWVRESALEAIQRIGRVPTETQLRGAQEALSQDRTSFGDSRFAFGILKGMKGLRDSQQKSQVVDALIYFLTHPGEGMWSDHMANAVAMLVELEPDRRRLITVFARILTDPAYEQRGDPRVAVCNALAAAGSDAKALVPSLRKAIAREHELITKGKYSRDKSLLAVLEETLAKVSASGPD